MLFSGDLVLWCNDNPFLLPGKTVLFLLWCNSHMFFYLFSIQCVLLEKRRIPSTNMFFSVKIFNSFEFFSFMLLTVLSPGTWFWGFIMVRIHLTCFLIGNRSEIKEAGWKLATALAISELWVLKLCLSLCFLLLQMYSQKTSKLDQLSSFLVKKCDSFEASSFSRSHISGLQFC